MLHYQVLFLGVFLNIVLIQTAIVFPGCEPDKMQAAVTKCYTDNGLPYDQFIQNVSNNLAITTDANYYKSMCANRQNISKSVSCIRTEYDRCSMLESAPTLETVNQLWAVCDDPRYNLSCVAEADHHYPELTYCITTRTSQLGNTTVNWKDELCQSFRIAQDCQVEMVRKCDNYTANVMVSHLSQSLPPFCLPNVDTIIGR
ncbi:unnamed protein product [Lymnaea stagnalis]|uniref:Uncharacterized protein n=1 Tax=Lymnaea stagnalis TaxID=6523 RepID=A0AAV2H051_LYMST